jgi:hypothetical protein
MGAQSNQSKKQQNSQSREPAIKIRKLPGLWKAVIFFCVLFNAIVGSCYMSGTWELRGSLFDEVMLNVAIGCGVGAFFAILGAFMYLEDR